NSSEPPRLSRRLQILRGWSHDKTEPVLTRSADAGSADGFGARSGARLAVGGHHLDRREDRLYGGDAPEVGSAGGAGPGPAARPDDRGATAAQAAWSRRLPSAPGPR